MKSFLFTLSGLFLIISVARGVMLYSNIFGYTNQNGYVLTAERIQPLVFHFLPTIILPICIGVALMVFALKDREDSLSNNGNESN